MRLSNISLQQTTILTIHSKKKSEEIQQEIHSRMTSIVTQISIVNSQIDLLSFPALQSSIQTLLMKKSLMTNLMKGKIVGKNLKILELTHCHLTSVPKIYSDTLIKLNLSHNFIEELKQIPSVQTLKVLNIRNNRLKYILSDVFYLNSLTVLYEFNITSREGVSLQTDERKMVDIIDLIDNQISKWNNQQILDICSIIVENDNEHLMSQLLQFLTEELITLIFQFAKTMKKRKIITLFIQQQKVAVFSLEEKIELLVPSLMSYQFIKMIPLELLIKSLNLNSKETGSIFLEFVQKESEGSPLFIGSEKDLINFMSLSLKYPHHLEIPFLLTQRSFFQQYDFDNTSVLKYLLHLDSFELFSIFTKNTQFRKKITSLVSLKGIVRPRSKLLKMLIKVRKQASKLDYSVKDSWYYPQYRERQTFCLRNDLFDYQILKQYEEMQCSYVNKDFKYTLKFYNKGNQISLAKKIETQLKKTSQRGIKKSIALHSTCDTSLLN